MTQIVVSLPDAELSQFLTYLEEKGYGHSESEDDHEVPEWQKEEVRKSIRETKPEDYIPWEVVRARIFRTHK